MKKFLTAIFRIAMHPVIAVIFNGFLVLVAHEMELDRQFVHIVLQKSASDEGNDVFFYAMLAYYSLVMGMNSNRLLRKMAIIPKLILFAFPGVALYVLGNFGYFSELTNGYLLIFGIALFLTSIGSFVIGCIQFLLSKRADPLFPDIRSVPGGLKALLRRVRRVKITEILVIIVVVQLFMFGILWRRMNRIESRLGGFKSLSCDQMKTIENIKRSTVRVIGSMQEGTGMLVNEKGFILTNAHVLDEDAAPKIIFQDYSFKTAKVVYRNTESDIAVLEIEGDNYPAVRFGRLGMLEKFEELFLIGYPFGSDIRGDATVSESKYIATRTQKNSPVTFLQFDGAINPGNSGGPMVTACGAVVGMATMGQSGMGLAISGDSLIDALAFLQNDRKQWPKTEGEPALDPSKNPLDAVRAFYRFIRQRKFDSAFALISKQRIKDQSLKDWEKGYTLTLDVSLIDIQPVEDKEDTVFIKLRSIDLNGQDLEFRTFEGEWGLVFESDSWRLNTSNIKEVKNPSFLWYWK